MACDAHLGFWDKKLYVASETTVLGLVRNVMAHGDVREGKWRGNWRMEWVASTLTPPPNVVYPALLKLIRTPRLLAVDWTDAPTDLNGLVRFGERRNLVSARVPSGSARAIPQTALRRMVEWLVCERKWLWYNWVNGLELAKSDRGKPRETSVKIAGVSKTDRTQHLLNASQKGNDLSQLAVPHSIMSY